jgi:hypothetical protein
MSDFPDGLPKIANEASSVNTHPDWFNICGFNIAIVGGLFAALFLRLLRAQAVVVWQVAFHAPYRRLHPAQLDLGRGNAIIRRDLLNNCSLSRYD